MNTVKILLLGFCLPMIGFCAEPTKDPDTRMPPRGIAVPPAIRSQLEKEVALLGREIADLSASLKPNPELRELLPDVQIYCNAVRYALEDDIFYRTNDFAIAKKLLSEGRERARQLRLGRAPWNRMTGLIVRGYVSKIDGSVQPYGIVVPESYAASPGRPHRLDFWLHGRNDKLSELSFINERETRAGEFTPTNTLVLHPYGRYCNAYKFAGEVDVFEALENACWHYQIDPDRISMRGFSMGGAGVWHLAAHHAGFWAAASPGAGFVETPIYQKIFEKKPLPPWYEQTLWHLYDATDYAGNLYNCGLVAYSGEIDPQKQAADLMAKAMAAEGLTMTHIIGPNTAHKYEPRAKLEVAKRVDALAKAGRDPLPRKVKFTTWTLRYDRMKWVIMDGLEQHWHRARVNAEILDDHNIRAETTNVTALTFSMPQGLCPLTDETRPVINLDGQKITGPAVENRLPWIAHFQKKGTRWSLVRKLNEHDLEKRHGLQGPIDDAFLESFIMVRPTGKPQDDLTGEWMHERMTNAIAQWQLQFRGAPRVKNDNEITDADIESSNLILWGDPRSNKLLSKIAGKLPIKWDGKLVRVGGRDFPANKYVPLMIYPNPLNQNHYVVINSGFTFSDAAHLSNALQTPKLPDYAIVDMTASRSLLVPGNVVEAGFFDEHWRLAEAQTK